MSYFVLTKEKQQSDDAFRETFALDVLTGFSSKPKGLPSKYFYDATGSELFQKITETEEYYPFRAEMSLLTEHANKIVADFPKKFSLVELGAGDGKKTRVLLSELLKQGADFEYLPIDISEAAVADLTSRLTKERPELKIHGIVSEYADGLNWINRNRKGPKVVLLLGSNIGNFNQTQAIVFLRVIWNVLNAGDALFVGFDLKKDVDVMINAYNDRQEFTSRFNLNVLTRINRELGGNFQVENFEHFGTYNPRIGAMESYIISKCDQTVYIRHLQKSFKFKAFEAIHMEYSYKYTLGDVEFLAQETGFRVLQHYLDSKKYYSDFLFSVVKENPGPSST
ncbi:MAG: L-histidine N(alpha)-methyltransferase [Bdellovibrionales bacterium]